MQDSSLSRYIAYDNAQYPDLLRHIDAPPKGLYVAGQLRRQPAVAIVGSRRPTPYGKQVTYMLASELASAGITIVSGLALGLDAVAHQAALAAGGHTVAVLGSGLNQLYPASNRGLATKILSNGGAIVTEFEAAMPPLRHHFPARNRIIAGLCSGVVVTEADVSSGSLITATQALQCGRQVLAVPGNITSNRSAGPNNLLRSGAMPVTSASDVIEALGLASSAVSTTPTTPATKQEAALMSLMHTGLTNSRDLIEQSKLDAAEFARTITLMEITGKVSNLGGGVWILR